MGCWSFCCVTSPCFAKAVGTFWLVDKSWNNDHRLSEILIRTELNLTFPNDI